MNARAVLVTELAPAALPLESRSGEGGAGQDSRRRHTMLATMRSEPPLTLRRTGPGQVHLVSTAAGPLGGDHLELAIDVAPGTSLDVLSIASTLVLPGSGQSLMVINARVGAGASLRFTPEPTVLAHGCDHRMVVRLTLAATASVVWREEIVFGRHAERSGRCHARFDATVDGVPLLRQEFVVGDPAIDDSPAVYGDARCVGSTLLAGPAFAFPGDALIGDDVAVLPLTGSGTLVSALAKDAVALRHRLDWGESQTRM